VILLHFREAPAIRAFRASPDPQSREETARLGRAFGRQEGEKDRDASRNLTAQAINACR